MDEDAQIDHLIVTVKDYQISRGSVLKLPDYKVETAPTTRPIGVSLKPTPFPQRCFDAAWEIQSAYNELYLRVASDEAWLYSVLKDLVAEDSFAAALWKVHCDAKASGAAQDLTCGIFRSDYMLHKPAGVDAPEIKQVEFNTYSVAGGVHSAITADMHRHLEHVKNPAAPQRCPPNATTASLVSALKAAYEAYGAPQSSRASTTCILMVVQPNNVNIADERPLEYGLWNAGVPTYRCKWHDVLLSTALTDNNELLFHSPLHAAGLQPLEVAVVYHRAGYEAHEYDAYGVETRLQTEKSKAIKCPTVLAHLATFKRVQQALTEPGALEHFLPKAQTAAIRATFMPMFSLGTPEAQARARSISIDEQQVSDWVLKPNLEGGGHNIYREDICDFLKVLPTGHWGKYVMMEMIQAPPVEGVLLLPPPTEGYKGAVISELGIFGTCLWRKGDGGEVEVVINKTAGWSFKTKAAEQNEMSVAKGYGAFDSPLLTE